MRSEWWRGAIIYQVYPRSFFDSNGDGTGDIPGITAKLDYIRSLGVDAVWVSPFFKSPMRDFGYDIADYLAVDPIFGTNADFASFITAAHERDLKVVIDLVLAHTSDQHPWFKQSRQSRTNPKADWYVWADPKPDGTPPNNWLSVFGGSAWQWDSRRQQYYLHHYLRSQPNLNWHYQPVVDTMFDGVRFWLEAGVDGFRLDAITTLAHDPNLRDNPARPKEMRPQRFADSNNPFSWQESLYTRDQPRTLELLADLRTLIDRYDNRYLIGEIADVDMITVSAKYTRTGKHLHSCYNFELMQLGCTAELLGDIIKKTESVLGSGWTTWAMSNHDSIRVVSRFGKLDHLRGDDRALAKLLLAFLFSIRGGACLYEGEELGLTQAEVAFEDLQDPYGIEFWPDFKGRDGARTPMPWSSNEPNAGFSTAKPWLPIPPEHYPLAVCEQEKTENSALDVCRHFLAWRKQHPALIRGDLKLAASTDPVLVFERSDQNERVLCLFNISNRPATHLLSGVWQTLSGHGFSSKRAGDQLELPGFGAAFFSRS
ncbi:MAG: alpha-glucosidase [Verrucomicrobia bacterium]|nr:alpha-glucosidase [Verrucomicrobiota bacterium]